VYWRERGREEWETVALQGLFVPSNYQEIHDSRYRYSLRKRLTLGGDFTAGNGTGY